ncbi:MAG TPA: AIR synthase-related protein, partial [bacterium]|nr:AIR synthase-related protein [bacterium]
YRALYQAIRLALVRSAHDCSDGGLAVALAESAFAGGLGMQLELGRLARQEQLLPWELLFSESPSRLVVSVSPACVREFEQVMAGLPCVALGTVTAGQRLRIVGDEGPAWVDAELAHLKEAWQAPLREV